MERCPQVSSQKEAKRGKALKLLGMLEKKAFVMTATLRNRKEKSRWRQARRSQVQGRLGALGS